jgi:HEAT repeat protein
VDGIHFEPQSGEAAPRVEMQLRAERPVVVQGSADDAEVRRVLTYVVEHGEQFDPGVRLDSLDVLRTRTADPRVRAAMCQAARSDSNPAVRLKALEALRGLGADPDVRSAMLAVLADDDNSGLRVEAVNGLLAALGEADLPVAPLDNGAVNILRDRAQHDPNQYVRQRSAAALGQLASFDSNGAGGSLGSSRR